MFEELSDEVFSDMEYQAKVKASEDATESVVDDSEVARDRVTKKVSQSVSHQFIIMFGRPANLAWGPSPKLC